MNELVERPKSGDESQNSLRSSTFDPRLASPGQRAWLRFKKNRAAVFSAWYLFFLLVVILAWPILLKVSSGGFARLHDPDQLSDGQFAPPTAQHWFGTDVHGRD